MENKIKPCASLKHRYFLSFIFLIAYNAAAQTPAPTPETAVFSGPTSEQTKEIFQKIDNSDAPLTLRAFSPNPTPYEGAKVLWAGSSSNLVTDISDIVLHFERCEEQAAGETTSTIQTPGQPTPKPPVNSYDVALQVDKRWASFDRQYPNGGSGSGAMRSRIDGKFGLEVKTPYINGKDDSGFIFIVPRLSVQQDEWGLGICPRKIVGVPRVKEKGVSDYHLEAGPFCLKTVKFNVKASINGNFSTVGQVGKFEIKMATSKGVPRSEFMRDEAISTNPHPSLEYKAVSEMAPIPYSPEGFNEGILLTAIMQNKAGYVRRHFASHIVRVSEVEYSWPAMVAEARKMLSDSGPCYLVSKVRSDWIEYSRETVGFEE